MLQSPIILNANALMRFLTILRQPRLLTIWFLGFSSGLPLALTGSTLQAWFTQAGINVVAIGALSLVGMPYVWKFIWSPIMDRFVPPLWGRRRGWIALTQIGLCIMLFFLASMNPQVTPGAMGVLALLIAFLSASQDINTDAYTTEILHPEERGLGAATYIFAYRMAMLLTGGLGLVLADHLGWRQTYEIMAVLLGLLVIVTYKAEEPATVKPPVNVIATVVESFKDILSRDKIIYVLLFIVSYKIGDALALALMSTFLKRGLGFSWTEIGVVYKTMGLIATIMGAMIGGAILANLNLLRALFLFGLAQAFSNLMFVILALAGKSYFLMLISVFIEQFCSGMSTAALVAYLMSLCNTRYTATQFALFSALSAIGRVFLGPLAGVIQVAWGWTNLFWVAFFISFPGLILIWLIQRRSKLVVPACA